MRDEADDEVTSMEDDGQDVDGLDEVPFHQRQSLERWAIEKALEAGF